MGDVFISYAHEDKEFVNEIQKYIFKSTGLKAWRDYGGLRVGDRLPNKLKDAISCNDYFLVILSKDSIKSEWVEKEITWAIEKKSFEKDNFGNIISETIIPCVRDDEAKKYIKNHDHLKGIVYCNFIKENGSGYRNLYAKLENIIKIGQFHRESGQWDYNEDKDNESFITEYKGKWRKQPSVICYEPDNLELCTPLKKVSCKVEILSDSKEWRAGILLRKYNGDINSECFRFHISDKEDDWKEKKRCFARNKHMSSYYLDKDLTTLTYDLHDRPPIKDTNEYTLEVVINRDTNNFSILFKEVNSGSTIKLEKDKISSIEEIKQVAICAWTRKDEFYRIRFSKIKRDGLD